MNKRDSSERCSGMALMTHTGEAPTIMHRVHSVNCTVLVQGHQSLVEPDEIDVAKYKDKYKPRSQHTV